MKKIGKKEKNGMNPMKAIGPMIKTGMKATGPMMICTAWMSMDTSRRKEKEKERKARMMMAKEESQEMETASQTMFNLRPHQLLPYKNQQQQQAHYSSAASSSGHGFFAFAETEPARVDVLASTYAEQEEHRRTRRGGQNQRDATAQHNRRELKKFPVLVGDLDALQQGVQRRPARVPRQVGLQEGEASWKPLAKGTSLFSYGCSTEIEVPSHSECFAETKESDEQQSAFSFHTVQTDLACEKGLAFHTENSAPPTVCILDLGCTRAMGSRRAAEAFCRYVGSHPNSGMKFSQQVQDFSLQIPNNPSALRSS